jgi:hypothetical protein
MNQELILWGAGFVMSVIGIYVRMEMKLKELDIRVRSLENTDREMMKKLDRIIDAIAEIKLELKDKVDRH